MRSQLLRRALLIVLVVFKSYLSWSASDSGLSKQIDFQEQIERRVNSRLRLFDPIGQAKVSIVFKEISAPLPGTQLKVENFVALNQGTFSSDSIKQIDVKITTGKEALSDWMKTDIQGSLAGLGMRTNFAYAVYPAEQRAELEKLAQKDESTGRLGEELIKRSDTIATAVMQIANKMNQDILQKLVGGLLALCAVAVLFGLYLSNRHNTFLRTMIRDEVMPFIKSMQSSATTKVVLAGAEKGERSSDRSNGISGVNFDRDSRAIAELDEPSLEALFSDCYWCEQDDYAAYLWSVMSRDQQRSILSSRLIEASYIQFLVGRTPQNLSLNSDPNYVKPLHLTSLSQESVAILVRRHPSLWHQLSYLRRSTLPLSLRERLECLAAPVVDIVPSEIQSTPASAKRKLPLSEDMGDLSEDDELFLLANPDAVVPELRSLVRSLVWMSMISTEAQKRILTSLDATTLASAWIGPRQVLETLTRLLPDQKRALLESEVRKNPPSRNNDVMRYLVAESLREWSLQEELRASGEAASKKAA